jgi:hypothetical protein
VTCPTTFWAKAAQTCQRAAQAAASQALRGQQVSPLGQLAARLVLTLQPVLAAEAGSRKTALTRLSVMRSLCRAQPLPPSL